MIISFNKYHGTGNDFILIDNRNKTFNGDQKLIQHLCHRRFGIGADGLMLLQNKSGYDFEMIYYNADGGEGTMCGNGGRSIVAFAKHLGIVANQAKFIAADGEHFAEVISNNSTEKTEIIRLHMADVSKTEIINNNYFINTGSPHYILFVKDIENFDVFSEGKKLRYDEAFKPGGTNVNFVEEKKDYLFVRTYERGVEDETYSCGTGVTASTLAFALKNNTSLNQVNIKTKGGDLKVYFKKEKNTFTQIRLEGPATFVYSGIFEIR